MADLREEILKLTNPAPVFKDPEDNSEDETSAKLVDQTVDEYEEISQPSTLRRKTAILLGDNDRRYVGEKTSRKSLESEITNESVRESDDDDDSNTADDDDNGSSDDNDDYDDNADDAVEDVNNKFRDFGTKEFEFKDDGNYGKYADDDDDDDNDGSIDGHDDNDDGGDSLDERDDDSNDEYDDEDDDDKEASEDEGIEKFSRTATDEVAKGQAAKEQLGLWDVLLEGRIKLQKAVSIINQLPQTDNYNDYSDASETFIDEAGKAQQAVQHLLGSLVHLQDLLLNQNSETKHLLDDTSTTSAKKMHIAVDDDDEEILSDSEVEMEAADEKSQTVCRKRKLKLGEYPGFLKKRHEGFQKYRNATIQKWFDKTRLAAGKVKGKSFSAFDQSAVVQINQILADKTRLIRRTQLKRTVYRVLGTTPRPEQAEILPTELGEEQVSDKEHGKEHDEEVFDDDDFYHQLLRELIEKKTSDVSDPVALSRQWLEIQKLRSKNKKKVDTRASKGRKVRYDVHKKLTNFMAPVNCCEWSHEARDDLFKSLFGKRFSNMNQISS